MMIIIIITIVNADKRGVTPGFEPNGKLAQYCVKFPLGSIPGITPRLSLLTIVIILIILSDQIVNIC